MTLASVYSPPTNWAEYNSWDKTRQNMEGYPIGAYQPDLTIRTVMDYLNGTASYVTVAGPRDLLGTYAVIRELPVPGGIIENVPVRYNDVGSAIKADKTNPQGYGAQIDIPFDRDLTNGQMNTIPYSKTQIDVVPVSQSQALAISAANNAGKAVPTSAQLAEAPQPGVTSGSMGGLLGPIQFEQPAAPPTNSFFQGTPAAGILAQKAAQDEFFDPINFGTQAGFSRQGTTFGSLGSPVMPSLFGDAPELSYAAAGQQPGVAAIEAALAPQAAPPTGAQLPGLGGMPPAGTFGSIPLGNYSMASVPAPAPQPSASLTASGQLAPSGSLSLSGKAVADPLAALAGLPSADELRANLPAPGSQPQYSPSTPAPQAAAAPTAFGTNYAPNDTATQTAKPAERFWSERLPGEGELNPVTSVEYAPASAPSAYSAPNTTTPQVSAPFGSLGAIQPQEGPLSAPTSVKTQTIDLSGAPTAPVSGGVGTFAAPPAAPSPYAGLSVAVAPNEDAMQLPAASQDLPAPATPLTLNELPAAQAPVAFGGVAPVDLPATPTTRAGLPGTEWQGLAGAVNPPADTITAPPTVTPDLLSPSLTPQEAIPTVKAPDMPAPPAAPAGPLAGMPAPMAAPAPAVRSAPVAAPISAPQAPISAPQGVPISAPQAPPAFGAVAAPQAQAAPSAYGTMPVGDWSWNATTMTPQSFGAYGSFANISDWTPASYEFAPTEVQIAATGSGPFGALADAFGGGSSFGYDYGGIY